MAASVVGGGNTHRMCVGRSSIELALGLMSVAVVAGVILVAVRKSRARWKRRVNVFVCMLVTSVCV